MKSQVLGVIPARWKSTRFEGKVLAPLAGKPMIQHVWERCRKSKLLNDLWIACDDAKVKAAVEKFGATAVMTRVDHISGTDRIAEAAAKSKANIIINIQGDEPLINPDVIDSLADVLLKNSEVVMATTIMKCNDPLELQNPNVVKVVINQNADALYFTRAAIPFDREKKGSSFYKHLGIYGYRKDFLLNFQKLPKSKLEEIEKLEQLRVLEAGYKIRTVETTVETIGVDTPEDLKRVEQLLSKGKNG